jgi:hypothetical protein
MTSEKRNLWLIGTLTATAVLICLILEISKFASHDSSGTGGPVNDHFEIRVGEMPHELTARYGDRVVALTRNQAVYGISWYQLDWPEFDGTLFVGNGGQSLQLDQVGGVQGVYDRRDYPGEGISGYSIYIAMYTPALGPRHLITHQDAHTMFYGVLRRIRTAGWERYVPAYAPRLRGAETFTYLASGLKNANLYSMDAVEMPGFEQWMKLENRTKWKFYKDGVYMTVTFDRDSYRMDPASPGDYLITMDLISRDAFQRNHLEEADRPRWKALYPGTRKRQREERAAIEAELSTKGYTIDTTYRNPDES